MIAGRKRGQRTAAENRDLYLRMRRESDVAFIEALRDFIGLGPLSPNNQPSAAERARTAGRMLEVAGFRSGALGRGFPSCLEAKKDGAL